MIQHLRGRLQYLSGRNDGVVKLCLLDSVVHLELRRPLSSLEVFASRELKQNGAHRDTKRVHLSSSVATHYCVKGAPLTFN